MCHALHAMNHQSSITNHQSPITGAADACRQIHLVLAHVRARCPCSSPREGGEAREVVHHSKNRRPWAPSAGKMPAPDARRARGTRARRPHGQGQLNVMGTRVRPHPACASPAATGQLTRVTRSTRGAHRAHTARDATTGGEGEQPSAEQRRRREASARETGRRSGGWRGP